MDSSESLYTSYTQGGANEESKGSMCTEDNPINVEIKPNKLQQSPSKRLRAKANNCLEKSTKYLHSAKRIKKWYPEEAIIFRGKGEKNKQKALDFNNEAKNYIFNKNNYTYNTLHKIDLHYLHKEEALDILKSIIMEIIHSQLQFHQLRIITVQYIYIYIFIYIQI